MNWNEVRGDSRWWRGLAFAERVQGDVPTMKPGGAGFDRLLTFREQLTGHDAFDAVLRFLAIGPGELGGLLEEPDQALASRLPPPPWLARALRAWERADELRESAPDLSRFPTWYHRCAAIVWPLLASALRAVKGAAREILATRGVDFNERSLADACSLILVERAAGWCNQVIVSEMHEQRSAAELPGDSAKERFERFALSFAKSDLGLNLLAEHPVLMREMARQTEQFVDFMRELFIHIAEDWSLLREQLAGGASISLRGITGSKSDPHRGGREVLFIDVGAVEVVYKPRSTAIEQRFFEDYVPRYFGDTADRLRVLDRGTHGWMELAEHSACSTEAEASEFFHRQGGILALAYFLGIADLHAENIIARADHPILIDLETALHPEALVGMPKGLRADRRFSLFDTCILPEFQRHQGFIADLGGMANVNAAETKQDLPAWEDAGTDNARIVYRKVRLGSRSNLPHTKKGLIGLEGNEARVLDGFARMYGQVLDGREEFASLVKKLAGVRLRAILRPTQEYANYLGDFRHPHLLADGLMRDLWLTQLVRDGLRERVLNGALEAEWKALSHSDVPTFWAEGGGREIFSDDGEVLYVRRESGVEAALDRLGRAPSVDYHLWQIKASFALAGFVSKPAAVGSLSMRVPEGEPLRSACIEAAARIGQRLLDLSAPTTRGGLDWLTVDVVSMSQAWGISVLDEDLYNGLSGMGFFFLALGEVTGRAAFSDAGERALWEAFCRWKTSSTRHLSGGFTGTGSLLYALLHASARGVAWASDRMSEVFGAIREGWRAGTGNDLIRGDAGLLVVLTRLLAYEADAEWKAPARALASEVADGLVGRAISGGEAAWWTPDEGFGKTPLCGISHGVAGISFALAEAAKALGRPDLGEWALRAVRYESGQFEQAVGDWPSDLDPDAAAVPAHAPPHRFPRNWCHGAPGIGVARLSLLSMDGTGAIKQDLVHALRATMEGTTTKSSHVPCHGVLGNLECAMLMADALGDSSAAGWVLEIAREQLGRDGGTYDCNNPLQLETPGLMAGLAGVGYAWLRLALPARLPSILVLEGPRSP